MELISREISYSLKDIPGKGSREGWATVLPPLKFLTRDYEKRVEEASKQLAVGL